MNKFEFNYVLSIHGNASIPRLKQEVLTVSQQKTLNLATAYYIEVLARKKIPHPLANLWLGNYHEGWAGLLPSCSSMVYDYEEFKHMSAVGYLSNIL